MEVFQNLLLNVPYNLEILEIYESFLVKENKIYKIILAKQQKDIIIKCNNYMIFFDEKDLSLLTNTMFLDINKAYEFVMNIFEENKVYIKEIKINKYMKLIMINTNENQNEIVLSYDNENKNLILNEIEEINSIDKKQKQEIFNYINNNNYLINNMINKLKNFIKDELINTFKNYINDLFNEINKLKDILKISEKEARIEISKQNYNQVQSQNNNTQSIIKDGINITPKSFSARKDIKIKDDNNLNQNIHHAKTINQKKNENNNIRIINKNNYMTSQNDNNNPNIFKRNKSLNNNEESMNKINNNNLKKNMNLFKSQNIPIRNNKKLFVKLTQDEKVLYSKIYNYLDPENKGTLDGRNAANFMKSSNLDRDTLINIWLIASPTKTKFLEKEELFVFLRLIALAQNNMPISVQSIEKNYPIPPLPNFNIIIDNKSNDNNQDKNDLDNDYGDEWDF